MDSATVPDSARVWATLHSQARYRPRYPSEPVIRFAMTQFPSEPDARRRTRILDLGCGAGRHTIFLAREGFQVYGTDISETGLTFTCALLASEGLSAKLQQASMDRQPFRAGSFDGIVAHGVLSYNDRQGFEATAAEMFRLLRKGGRALVVTRTTADYRFGRGKRVDAYTFLLETPETSEAGMINHFLDEARAREVFASFRIVELDLTETSVENRQRIDSDWIILLEK